MPDPAQLQQIQDAMQQQMQMTTALAFYAFRWWILAGFCLSAINAVSSFYLARWFLLHVFEMQQKRFFTQLDIFLHQRGIAPHIAEPTATPQAQPNPFQPAAQSPVQAAVKDLAAELDSLIAKGHDAPSNAPSPDRTPLERAWDELNGSAVSSPAADDSRFRPKD